MLINNAGAINATRRLTVDGIEATLAVNHLAPFLLTRLLLDVLTASVPARVVNLTARLHRGVDIPFDDLQAERRFHPFERYRQSKLACLLFTYELARRLAGTGVTANCVHPGVVGTAIIRDYPWARLGAMLVGLFLKTPERGARTPIYAASAPQLEGVSGKYFRRLRRGAFVPAIVRCRRGAATMG